MSRAKRILDMAIGQTANEIEDSQLGEDSEHNTWEYSFGESSGVDSIPLSLELPMDILDSPIKENQPFENFQIAENVQIDFIDENGQKLDNCEEVIVLNEFPLLDNLNEASRASSSEINHIKKQSNIESTTSDISDDEASRLVPYSDSDSGSSYSYPTKSKKRKKRF
ncbi:uncharacterized protein LOC126735045 [Anthonomus grandis grandis]|uniref:uncharacterized protein LOC126735045 n=1 Tax=Anthonomus grandis grandis TaxID=2921223 RepID=UPI002165B32F|nr:uncharacterized protein LOC126735045 [Anthonomus grandis grandis]